MKDADQDFFKNIFFVSQKTVTWLENDMTVRLLLITLLIVGGILKSSGHCPALIRP